MTHICVSRQTITGSDNGLSPGWRQAIIWTNAGILLIGPLGTNFSENLIEILTFSFKKMRLKVSSAKWRPFCLGLNVLTSLRDTHQAYSTKQESFLHWWGCSIQKKHDSFKPHWKEYKKFIPENTWFFLTLLRGTHRDQARCPKLAEQSPAIVFPKQSDCAKCWWSLLPGSSCQTLPEGYAMWSNAPPHWPVKLSIQILILT